MVVQCTTGKGATSESVCNHFGCIKKWTWIWCKTESNHCQGGVIYWIDYRCNDGRMCKLVTTNAIENGLQVVVIIAAAATTTISMETMDTWASRAQNDEQVETRNRSSDATEFVCCCWCMVGIVNGIAKHSFCWHVEFWCSLYYQLCD